MNAVVFDIETTPIKDWLDPRPERFLCAATQDLATEEIKVFYDVPSLMDELNRYDTWIGHNLLAFDIPALRALGASIDVPATHVLDTLVASRLERFERDLEGVKVDTPHSLESWGVRLGFPKGDHKDFTTVTPELVEYCKRDVVLTRALYNYIYNNILIYNILGAYELELEIASIISNQSISGIYFNTTLANELITYLSTLITTIDTTLNHEAGTKLVRGADYSKPFKVNGELSVRVTTYCDRNGIDIPSVCGPFCGVNFVAVDWGSTKQVVTYFTEKGWVPTVFTEKGSPKLDGVEEFNPIGKLIGQRNEASHKLASVTGWLEHVRPDGTISAGANPLATNTHRMRHQRVVNVPKASTYPKTHPKAGQLVWKEDPEYQDPKFGTELRALFQARPGRVLFGYDASALELRILAHYINNENYTRVICNEDPHVFAQRAADLPSRQSGKILNYALVYGASDKRLGSLKGGGARDGAVIRKRLYAAVPGLQRLDTSVKTAAKKGFLKGLDGRHLYVREGKSPLNTLIQGGGATVMKYVAREMNTLIAIDKTLDNPIKVLDMHDEAQFDINPSDAEIMHKYMEMSFAKVTELLGLNCPVIGESKVGNNWAETH